MIIFYSATGNSKYVAKCLGESLQDEVIDSLSFIKEGRGSDFHSEKPFVFVFPIFVSKMPEIFEKFILKSNFSGNKKAYFVSTFQAEAGIGGNCGMRICKKNGLEFMGMAEFVMPQNYIMSFFKMQDEEECRKRIANAKVKAVELAKDIAEEKVLTGAKIGSAIEVGFTRPTETVFNFFISRATKKFYITDACIGCGLCERKCPLNNITMVDKKPQWGKKCIHCSACVNGCPKKAVEYGKSTQTKNRYQCDFYK